MRQLLFPRRPLSRTTLVACHLMLQIGLLALALLWLAPRSPWLDQPGWGQAWPALALGTGTWLLAAIGLRVLAELCLLPHHLAALRPGFTASDMVTRSYERRPAVHDEDDAWTSEAHRFDPDTGVLGSARVTRPAQRLRPRGDSNEPSLDLAGDQNEIPPYRDPYLL